MSRYKGVNSRRGAKTPFRCGTQAYCRIKHFGLLALLCMVFTGSPGGVTLAVRFFNSLDCDLNHYAE